MIVARIREVEEQVNVISLCLVIKTASMLERVPVLSPKAEREVSARLKPSLTISASDDTGKWVSRHGDDSAQLRG